MKLLSFILILIAATTLSCHHHDIAVNTPRCIYKEIASNSKNPEWMTGSVKEYEFQGKLVYSFDPDPTRIADGASIIKDAQCNTLCTVGGFAGPQHNQCLGGNFFKDAVYKRTIWEKKE